MSSILKALRKIEEEKRGSKLEAPDLRVDQGQPAAAKRNPLLHLMAGGVLGAVFVGLLFLWPAGLKQERDRDRVVVAPPVASQTQPAAQGLVDQPVASDTAGNQQDAALAVPVNSEASSASPQSELAAPGTEMHPAPAPVSDHQVVRPADTMPSSDPGPAAAPVVLVAGPEPPAEATTLPEGIKLTVTEVFYQGADKSMAVVNDLPVMVGSYVDSAVVTEIHADHVLFEVAGNIYSVPVSLP